MAANAAYLVTYKKGGTSTAFNAQAMTPVTVAGKTNCYQITDATKQIWDPSVTPTVSEGTIVSIDYLRGIVQFTTSEVSPTVSGNYIPTAVIGGSTSYKLDLKRALTVSTAQSDLAADITAVLPPTERRIATVMSATLDISRYDDFTGALYNLLIAGTPILVEIGQAAGTILRRGWFIMSKDDADGGLKDLEKESISLTVASQNGVAAFSFGR